jgi:hypothetical protein
LKNCPTSEALSWKWFGESSRLPVTPRVRGLELPRLNWIYVFREKIKLAVTKTVTATKWVGGRLRPLFPEKRFRVFL